MRDLSKIWQQFHRSPQLLERLRMRVRMRLHTEQVHEEEDVSVPEMRQGDHGLPSHISRPGMRDWSKLWHRSSGHRSPR